MNKAYHLKLGSKLIKPPSMSTNMKTIKIYNISPSLSHDELSLPLTLFDMQWLKSHAVNRLYYYNLPDLNTQLFLESVVPNLKESLPITLSHFLPLAGNVIWPSQSPKPILHYSPGDSVLFTIAESRSEDFDILTGAYAYEAIKCCPLVPKLATCDTKASAIALQVTLFPYKGLSIGISSHHAVLDGKSSTMFMKAWAHINKLILQGNKDSANLLPDELTPFFNRDVIEDRNRIDMVFLNHVLKESKFYQPHSDPRSLKLWDGGMTIPESLVRQTFKLTKEDINILRNKAFSWQQKVDKEKVHLSTFVITSAYVLICMLKTLGFETNKRAYYIFAADFRARLDPPVPTNYVGNCIGVGGIVAIKQEYCNQDDGMANVADKIRQAIKETEKKAMEGAEQWLSKVAEIGMGGHRIIGPDGSPRFEVYKTDFGWGRPKKALIVSTRDTVIAMGENKDENAGGVEVNIVLNKAEMESFASEYHMGLKD